MISSTEPSICRILVSPAWWCPKKYDLTIESKRGNSKRGTKLRSDIVFWVDRPQSVEILERMLQDGNLNFWLQARDAHGWKRADRPTNIYISQTLWDFGRHVSQTKVSISTYRGQVNGKDVLASVLRWFEYYLNWSVAYPVSRGLRDNESRARQPFCTRLLPDFRVHHDKLKPRHSLISLKISVTTRSHCQER